MTWSAPIAAGRGRCGRRRNCGACAMAGEARNNLVIGILGVLLLADVALIAYPIELPELRVGERLYLIGSGRTHIGMWSYPLPDGRLATFWKTHWTIAHWHILVLLMVLIVWRLRIR